MLVLWLAIAGIVVLIFWGIARSFVTSNLRHESEADVESLITEVIAESAVAEAEARLGWQVNALESPVAELFRGQVLANATGEVDLTPHLQLPQTRKMLEAPAYRGYSIDRFEAHIQFQKQIDNVPNERRALVTFAASVSSPGLVRRAARRLELARWAKVTLVTPPRPFGNFGLFLLDAGGLTDAAAANRLRDRALALVTSVRAAVKAMAAPGSPNQQPLEALLGETFDPESQTPPPPQLVMPDGAAFYGLAEQREPQRLKALDVAGRMQELVAAAEKAQTELTAAGAGGDPTAQQNAARNALAAAVAPLLELWTFERNYAAVAAGTKDHAPIAAAAYKLTDEYFRRRAHYEVRESPGHTDLSVELGKLLARPVQGVIAVANKTPVTITGEVPGRVIVVVGPGGANVRSVNASDQTSGMITVVCSAGPLRVAGACSVNLVLADTDAGRGAYQLIMERDAKVHGSLIATGLPPGGFQEGELERDDRTFSGFTDPVTGKEVGLGDRFYVGLSPRTFYRRMVKL